MSKYCLFVGFLNCLSEILSLRASLFPLTASLFITIRRFRYHGSHRFGLFNSRFNREIAIQKMIDAGKRMKDVQSQVGGEAKEGWGINPIRGCCI